MSLLNELHNEEASIVPLQEHHCQNSIEEVFIETHRIKQSILEFKST